MRLDKFKPRLAVPDPKTRTGVHESFISGHLASQGGAEYDLYLVNGVVYVCRDGAVAVFLDQGVCFVNEEAGRKLSEDFAKKWPRPKVEDAVQA